MNYVIITCVCIIVVLILVYQLFVLKEKILDAMEAIGNRDEEIAIKVAKIASLNGKLVEANDRIESLIIVGNNQDAALKDFYKRDNMTKAKEANTVSIPHPIAPADLTKKALVRDAKGHFVKN